MRLWPLPALATWALAWLMFLLALGMALPGSLAAVGATLVGVLLSLAGDSAWRRTIMATGFPLSLLASGVEAVPPVAWLVLLLGMLLLYPLRAWRDAPLFPTPRHALHELPRQVRLPPGARILDAGCGLGHGLRALHAAYPDARLQGLEWSWPLRAVCALRCPYAQVRHGDIWQARWDAYAMVYLFQRPETMARAAAKAMAEMAEGSYLVSLEFSLPAAQAQAEIALADGRTLWVYRLPLVPQPAVPAVGRATGSA